MGVVLCVAGCAPVVEGRYLKYVWCWRLLLAESEGISTLKGMVLICKVQFDGETGPGTLIHKVIEV